MILTVSKYISQKKEGNPFKFQENIFTQLNNSISRIHFIVRLHSVVDAHFHRRKGLSGIKMSNARFSKPVWHLVDARNKIVGRLATQIVHILKGKHKPTYTPHYDCGDYVVVVNAKDVKFTGKKYDQKLYTWHTGYAGGLKQRTVKEQLEIKPEEVFPPYSSLFICLIG